MTQSEALNILKTGANVFLTGEPGSGKTHTVNEYVRYLNSCGIEPAITASTGIAATHIGGVTIHSWCGIGVKERLTPYDLDTISGNRKVVERVGNTKILIIDEVSMLSANTLAMADAVCREVRRHDEPFGGLQVVLVGDFFQLPPVSRQGSDSRSAEELPSLDFDSGVLSSSAPLQRGSPESSRGRGGSNFAFTSPAWQKAAPLVCYLSEQHRQEDEAFLEFLGAVRRGEVAERHRALLRTRYSKTGEAGVTQLYSHNANVDHLNTAELSKLSGQPKVFVMTGSGPDPLVVALKRGCLSPEVLSLKLGARVMFTKNDMGGRFVNGTTGTIAEFTKETGMPVVKTDSGRTIPAEPVEWNIQDGGRILARIEQIPLRLAWAITVHKSQGMSLDRAHMDLSAAFEYGQGYVAISRVRTLKGLSLSGLNARALEVHPDIKAKDAHFRSHSDTVREKFGALEKSELAQLHINFIKAIGGTPGAGRTVRKKKEKVDTLSITKDLALQGLSLRDIAKERGMTAGTILNHLEQLKEKKIIVPVRDLSHLTPDPDRFAEMEKAFTTVFKKTKELKLSPVRGLLDDSFSFDELRLARLFLGVDR
ncbi:MAG: AAA family ATPase [Candidatus Taylorbacteria bacterium]|nr:AAA family ATPase [Candidatus Taylorbacteria bacterium]